MECHLFATVEGGEENAASTDQAGEELAAQDNVLYEEEEEEDDDVVDLRAFGAIGPLMFIELLDLPPQPKMVKGWTMQQSKSKNQPLQILVQCCNLNGPLTLIGIIKLFQFPCLAGKSKRQKLTRLEGVSQNSTKLYTYY